jgi:hypothetical protein
VSDLPNHSDASGKGDNRRLPQVSREEFDRNWERTFGSPKREKQKVVPVFILPPHLARQLN